MTDEIVVGTRVRVLDTNQNDLGLGTYQGEISFDEHGNEIPYTSKADDLVGNPKILLDTGKTIYGFECWWYEEDENLNEAVEKLKDLVS